MHEPEHHLARLVEGVLEGPPRQRFRHGVQKGDPAGRVGGQHRIRDAAQRDREHLALLAPGRLVPPARRDVLDGEEHQGRRPVRAEDLAGIEEHGLGAKVRKRVRDLEVVEGGVVGHNLLQQVPQGGNVPLAIAQVVEPVRLRLLGGDLEALIKIPIRHEHVQGGVQHHQRDPHRVHNACGVEQGHASDLLQDRWPKGV